MNKYFSEKFIFLGMLFFFALPIVSSQAQVDGLHEQPGKAVPLSMAQGSDRLLAQGDKASQTDEMNDHKAEVFRVEGDVKILKHASDEWIAAEKGMILEVGDQVLTGKDSFLEVVYDSHFLNIARIEEKTKAEFRHIEPTDLHLSTDGAIFSALDGLKPGSQYQVSTATAVASVRGTHFAVEVQGGSFSQIAVIPDTKSHESAVELLSDDGKSMSVPEGQQLNLRGESPELGAIDASVLDRAAETVAQVEQDFGVVRQEGLEQLAFLETKSEEGAQESSATEKSEDSQAPLKDSGDEKVGDKPNDGGDSLGDGSGPQGNEGGLKEGALMDPSSVPSSPENAGGPQENLASEVDAMIDSSLTPPEGFSIPAPEGERPGRGDPKQEGMKKDTKDGSEHRLEGPQGKRSDQPQVDFGKMMEFFAVGGMNQGELSGTENREGMSNMLSGFFEHLGFNPEMSGQMAEGIGQLMGNENFRPENFLSGTAFAAEPFSQMPFQEMATQMGGFAERMNMGGEHQGGFMANDPNFIFGGNNPSQFSLLDQQQIANTVRGIIANLPPEALNTLLALNNNFTVADLIWLQNNPGQNITRVFLAEITEHYQGVAYPGQEHIHVIYTLNTAPQPGDVPFQHVDGNVTAIHRGDHTQTAQLPAEAAHIPDIQA